MLSLEREIGIFEKYQIVVLSCHPRNDGRITRFLGFARNHFGKVLYLRVENAGLMANCISPLPDAFEIDGYSNSKIWRRIKLLGQSMSIDMASVLANNGICLAKKTIIHVHDPSLLILGIRLKKMMPLAKLVYDKHEWVNLQHFSLSNLENFIYESIGALFVDEVVMVTGEMEDEVSGRFGSIPQAVVENYPSVSVFSSDEVVRKIDSFQENQPVKMVYFGSLSPIDRYIPLMLDIMGKLLDDHTNVDICVGGRGASRDVLLRLDQMNNQYGGRFEYLGEVPYEKVIEKTSKAHFGFLIWTDEAIRLYPKASPNKFYEYCAYGVIPIIKANIGGELPRDAIILTEDKTDVTGTVQRIQEKLYDKQALSRIWEFGKTKNWESESQKYLSLYRKVGFFER